MATIKVFDVNGVKELLCFDTLDNVPYDEVIEEDDLAESEASDDLVDF